MVMMLSCVLLCWLVTLTSSFQTIIRPLSVGKYSVFQLFSEEVTSSCGDDANTTAQHLVALDPSSDRARQIVMKELGLSESTYQKLAELSHVITDLNQQVNLVSRKDCSPATVFGRHVLPCTAAWALADSPLTKARTAVDVGTGGGFPGLVLAILYPNTKFLLLDSVGKKLAAVQEAARRLQLDNVQTHHGRAEDCKETFDVATGRSVAELSQFCGWMYHLLAPKGTLLYWIGGAIHQTILQKASRDEPLRTLVSALESSDKRILAFSTAAVKQIAKESGLPHKTVAPSEAPGSPSKTTNKTSGKSRGEWKQKEAIITKQRGYDNFKRYSSSAEKTAKKDE